MSLKERYLVQVWQERGGCLPYLVPLDELDQYVLQDRRKSEAIATTEDTKSQEVSHDTTISYENASLTTNDYLVVLMAGTEATTGIPVSEQKEIAPTEFVSYEPTVAGYYGIMWRTNDPAGTYAIDTEYPVRYVQPANPSVSPYKGGIPGWTLHEFPDYYKLRLNLTDDMNSDYEFQKYMFEICYTYVKEDRKGSLEIPVWSSGERTVKSTPSLSNIRIRNTSSSVRGEDTTYPFPIIFIEDTIDYNESDNNKYVTDIIQYQHRFLFCGDSFIIEKFYDQATVGKYLVFAIKRRTIGTDMDDVTDISGPWGVPVEQVNESIDISALETSVGNWSAPDGKSIAEILEDANTGLIDKTNAIKAATIDKPLIVDKLNAIADRDDGAWEILRNKIIINPVFNDVGESASVIFSSSETSNCYAIMIKEFGTDGNGYTLAIKATGASSSLAYSIDGTDLTINLATDGDSNPITTFLELETYLNSLSEFTDIALIAREIAGHDSEVVAAKTKTSFTGGTMGAKVGYSSAEMEAVFSQYHKDKYDATVAPGATNDSTEDYSVGSRWYDAVAKEWYICTDSTEDNATWDIMTLSAADLGTAAVADIVNDLSTGGTTDVLSAEQGKVLFERIEADDAPTMAVAASGSIELDTGISLDFTAKTKGVAGNSIVVNLVDPQEENATIDVVVDGTEINITLASSAVPAITSTAANVKTAIENDAGANALISVGITGETSTLAIEDDVTLDNGVDGTTAPLGKMIMDTANGKLWMAFAECTISDTDGWVSFSKDS